jgi:hypothetical protein
MIFGKKSDVKKHFTSKHSMFSHTHVVEDAPNKTGQARGEEQSNDQSPPAKVERPKDIPLKS